VVPNRQNLLWLTKTTIQLKKNEEQLQERPCCSRSSVDYSKFKQLRNKVVSELQLEKQRFSSNLHPQNPRVCESYKSTQSKGKFFSISEKVISLLVLFWTRPIFWTSPSPTIYFNCSPTVALLSDTTKSSDDDISTHMLTETALCITPVVTQLFNISLKLGVILDEWKFVCVTPILKSCNKETTAQSHCYHMLRKLLVKREKLASWPPWRIPPSFYPTVGLYPR